MIQRICYAIALVAFFLALGSTLLPLQDDCGIAWQAAFDSEFLSDCTGPGRRRLLVAGVAAASVAASALGVAYVFRDSRDDSSRAAKSRGDRE